MKPEHGKSCLENLNFFCELFKNQFYRISLNPIKAGGSDTMNSLEGGARAKRHTPPPRKRP